MMRTEAARRIVLADDHDLVREGYRRMLEHERDLEVVGEATNGREAVQLCRRLEPDLVLMDVRMPEMDGLEATREIKAEQPEVCVLVISTFENPDFLFEAMKAGAAGYVLKEAPKQELVEAVRGVLNGEFPLNQDLATRLIQRLAAEQPAARGAGSSHVHRPVGDLTPRELEVLALLARGMSNPQIAKELVITRGTAKIHLEHIIRKLGVSDRTQAVVRATELGLLNL